MDAKASGKDSSSPRSQRPRRYDKDLVRDRTLELLSVCLGPPREQGARAVWDCPACGKREKYSVVKASGKGGCLVADCRLAGSGDIFVMLAALENLDYKADFLAVLTRAYELLGLEPADTRRGPSGGSQRAAPKAVPVGRRTMQPPDSSYESPQPSTGGGIGTKDLDLASRAYERILEFCPLETRDRRYLRTRGLSNVTIRRGRFGTMTAPRASQVKAQLQRELGREALLSVPGFSEDEQNGRIKFTFTGAYILIPYHDAEGRITTIEGRVVGKQRDGRKYVTLRRAGNHLYLFPGHRPEELVAVCEGAMGAIVAAEFGITVGAIMGCERFRASPSPEMLDGAPGDPLLELKGTDFAGRTIPYIPDADDPPNPKVLRAAPKAARWIAEPQNARAAICLLPKGADLDEWLLLLDPEARADRFAELLARANPPEDGQPHVPPPAPPAGTSENDGSAAAAIPSAKVGNGHDPAPEALETDIAEDNPDSSSAGRGQTLTDEDLPQIHGTEQPSKSKKASSRKRATKEPDGNESQPGLWDDADEPSPQTAGRNVSRGARRLRDEVYRALIEKLPPKEEHLSALEKRGVMRATARVGRFASLDLGTAGKVVSGLAERFGAKRLLTVPGFEADDGGKVTLCPALGRSDEYVLIPCFDAYGFLTGVEGLPVDHRSGEVEAEETVPLKGAGSHLYVFAHYATHKIEGFCEGPLGALLAAQDDVVIGAVGSFRRYRAASGPGEGRQPMDAALPELEGVDFAGRQIPYAPRAGAQLGEANARFHEAPKAARWLVERYGGAPAVVGLAGAEDLSQDGGAASSTAVSSRPTSLGEWLLARGEDGTYESLRGIFPESPDRKGQIPEDEDAEGAVDHRETESPPGLATAAPPLSAKVVGGFVALAAGIGAVLALVLMRLRDFAGYVSSTPEGEPILYAGPFGPLRRLADSPPFQVLYDYVYVVALAAAVALALVFVARFRAAHVARWRADRLRLQERWRLHLAPEAARPSGGILTAGEAAWGVVAWPAAYVLCGWLLSTADALLSVAATLGMLPQTGPIVADPLLASVYAATVCAVFVLWRRRSIRFAEARMLAGKIRH